MNIGYIQILRPKHWVKNFAVVLPLIFAGKVGCAWSVGNIFAAAALFCLVSSFVYIINDIIDREQDKLHPNKKNRPIAAGKVSICAATVLGAVIFAVSIASAMIFMPQILFFILAYAALQLAYSFWLKRVVLLDVICIAMGFVIRASAGATAIEVQISPWLFICMFTLCMFMGFCKRYNEKAAVYEGSNADLHRNTLSDYTPQLLTHLVTLSAGIAVISFISYSMSPLTIESFGSEKLVYTLPVVVYTVFRFAMVSMKGIYEGPTDIILKDRPFMISACVWFLWVFVIIYKNSFDFVS